MKIDKQYLTINPYSRPGTKRSKTTKIAWHYIGNANSSAQANRNYFNNLATTKKTYASSHYIIGLYGEIIACVPEDEIAYTTNDANSYSIGIEMCHPTGDGKFNKATYDSAVELGVDLCKRYKLDPTKDFIRHYDVTGKKCPLYWVNCPSEWEKFKKDVYNKLNNQKVKIHIDGKLYEVDAIVEDGRTYVQLRGFEKAGYKVDYVNGVATINKP